MSGLCAPGLRRHAGRRARVLALALAGPVSALACGGGPSTTGDRVQAPREGVLFDPQSHGGTLRTVRLVHRFFWQRSWDDSARIAREAQRQLDAANLVYDGTSLVFYQITSENNYVYEGPHPHPCDFKFVAPNPPRSGSTSLDTVFPYRDLTAADSFPPEYLSLRPYFTDSIVVYWTPWLGWRLADGSLIKLRGTTGVANSVRYSDANGIVVLAYEAIDSLRRTFKSATLGHELFHELAHWGHSPSGGVIPPDFPPFDYFIHMANETGGYHWKPGTSPFSVGNTELLGEFDTKWAPPIYLTWYSGGVVQLDDQCARLWGRSRREVYFDSTPHP